MIAMIFEYWVAPGRYDEYLAVSAGLRELLADVDGFVGIERFESATETGKFAAIGFFRDEAAVTTWRNTPEHRHAQTLGRDGLFSDYRLRMAEVTRDYGPAEHGQAPADSQAHHQPPRQQ